VHWRAARYALKCSQLSVPDRQAAAHAVRQAARTSARAQHALFNLALAILREAAKHSAQQEVGTIEVRLTLYVLPVRPRPAVVERVLAVRDCSASPPLDQLPHALQAYRPEADRPGRSHGRGEPAMNGGAGGGRMPHRMSATG